MPIENRDGRIFDPDPIEGPEETTYMEEMYRARLPEQARRAFALSPKDNGSPEWFGAVGEYWRRARRDCGLLIREAASQSGLPLNSLRFLEAGLALPDELNGNMLPNYAQSLGKTELYTEFTTKFTSPDWHAGRDLPK